MEVINTNAEKYDRKAELQPFDEMKAGVKGLMDAAITKVPRIFVQPSKIEDSTIDSNEKFSFPIVDLDGISKEDPIKDILLEYTNQVMKLGDTLFELLSEAIGLEPNHLKDMGCSEGLMVLGHYYPACPQPELGLMALGHYYPACPQPELTLGTRGLQVLHQNHWVDVPPTPRALVVNIEIFYRR
ncbi:Deacetoxyvindoline 4-hydroxylase, partial [Capsicum chinense]